MSVRPDSSFVCVLMGKHIFLCIFLLDKGGGLKVNESLINTPKPSGRLSVEKAKSQ